VKGAEKKAKRSDLGSALDQISGWITSAFQVAQPARSSDIASRGKLSKNNNLPYISIGYGGEGVSQSPLKDQAFSTFLDQNPPFELWPKNGISPSTLPPNGPSSTTMLPHMQGSGPLAYLHHDSIRHCCMAQPEFAERGAETHAKIRDSWSISKPHPSLSITRSTGRVADYKWSSSLRWPTRLESQITAGNDTGLLGADVGDLLHLYFLAVHRGVGAHHDPVGGLDENLGAALDRLAGDRGAFLGRPLEAVAGAVEMKL
jgi:hypothetical protein